jgi:protein TonB
VQRGGWPITAIGSIGITFAVFLVLPLTQMVSSYSKRELMLRPSETLVLQAPPDLEEPPPPPPEEEPPEEPEPQLGDTEQPLNLNVDLDMAVGTGGAMAMSSLGAGEGLAEEMAQALDISDLDKPPTLVASVPPTYPAALRRAKVEGTVILVFVLSEEGRVDDPRVESSTHPEFEAPAVTAVRRWKFRPGEKNGEAVRTYMRLPIRFRVTG